MKNLLFVLFCFSFFSCGNDKDCSSIDVNEAINEYSVALSEALAAYEVDKSDENCEELKTAYENFIDEAKNLQDCANEVGEGEEYMQSIQEAEDSLDLLEC